MLFVFFMVIVIASVLFVIGFPIYLLRKYLKNRSRLIELYFQNADTLERYRKKVYKACDDKNEAENQLGHLKIESSREVWESLSNRLQGFHLAGLLEMLDVQRYSCKRSGWQGAKETFKELTSILELITLNTDILCDIKAKREELKKAKQICEHAAINLPLFFEKITNNISHPDVTDETRKFLFEAETEFKKTENNNAGEVSRLLRIVGERINSEKEFAEKARTEGPRLLKILPVNLQNTETKMAHNDVSEDSKKILNLAREKFNLAQTKEALINWIFAYPILLEVSVLIQQAERKAGEDISAAKHRRQQK